MLFHNWVKRVLGLENPNDAKEFIEDYLDGKHIDFENRVPRNADFSYKERPFEPDKVPAVLPGIPQEILDDLYGEWDSSTKTLDRLVWHTEDGIRPETLQLYGVAYDHNRDTIILPHHNRNGEIVGLYERSFWPLRKEVKEKYPDMPYKTLVQYPRAKYVPLLKNEKYIHDESDKTSWSFPNSENLYGLHLAKDAIKEKQSAIIFEGGKSVMLAHQMGIHNCVATHTFGAHMNHIAMLMAEGAKTIYLAFDKQYQTIAIDDPQWKLYDKRTYEFAKRVGQHVDVYRVCDYREEGKEKLDYKDAPIDKGEEIFRELLDHAEPLIINKEDAKSKSDEEIKAQARATWRGGRRKKTLEEIEQEEAAKAQLSRSDLLEECIM